MLVEERKQKFTKGEVVWHTKFNCKVTFLQELRHGWYYVILENGGLMETQMIAKYEQ